MGTREEWIDVRRTRPEWVATAELDSPWRDEAVAAGPFGLLVHSGCGDGALLIGSGPALALYLSRAAMLVQRHTGAAMRPAVFRAAVEELVTAASTDVRAWMGRLGIEVQDGSAMASLLDLVVNVALCRLKSAEPVAVEAVIQQTWPTRDVADAAGCLGLTRGRRGAEAGDAGWLLAPQTVQGPRGEVEVCAFISGTDDTTVVVQVLTDEWDVAGDGVRLSYNDADAVHYRR